ncbi:hypothetical protein KQX64_11125 [Rhodopseudomonas palustris]|nr:hypothetical protein KQX64_11125 [Rhodopseudomonas palustris]
MPSSVTRRAKGGLDSPALERLLFASFSLPSAALSAALPWPSSSMLLAPQQPLAPPFYFAAALCIGLHHAASVKLSEATVIFIGIFVAWAAAYNAAFSGISFFDSPDRWLPSQFGPQAAFIKAYHVALSGIVAGAIGGLGSSASVAVVRKAARSRSFFIRTIAIAAAAGGLLQAPSYLPLGEHLVLYLVWQPAVAWSFARDLVVSHGTEHDDRAIQRETLST